LKALGKSENAAGDPTLCNASGHCGLYQYSTATWQEFAPKAGVDISLFPTADTAPSAVQTAVAGVTPITHWTCPNCNSQAAGFAATPGFVTSSPGLTLADGPADTSSGFSTNQDPLSITAVDPVTGEATATSSAAAPSTDLGGLALPDAGTPQTIGLLPGLAKDIQGWVTGAETKTGAAFAAANTGWLGTIQNAFVRFFLILGALVIAAIALYRLTDPSGEKLKTLLRSAA
jgi:hypothetical protein